MRIALEIVPAHHSIDDGYSRVMYSFVNALCAHASRHEYLVILGATGNPGLIQPGAHTTIVQCPPGNQNIRQQHTAAQFARRWGADLLHNFGAPASLMWSRPLILTIHDAAIATHPAMFPKRWVLFQRYAYGMLKKKNPRVITVSEYSRRDIAAHMGFPLERISVVHPIPSFTPRPVPDSERAHARETLSLPAKYFLYLGVIEPRKNLVRLIHAFDAYKDAGGDAELVIGGTIGWKAEPTVAAARASRYAREIHFTGYLPNEMLPATMAGARAFVFPSLSEGFGIPPIEAMMFDVPVLSSSVSCLPEVLGDAALLVDPLDESAIAAGLLTLDRDTSARDHLIMAGRLCREKYTAEHAVSAIERVYDLVENETRR